MDGVSGAEALRLLTERLVTLLLLGSDLVFFGDGKKRPLGSLCGVDRSDGPLLAGTAVRVGLSLAAGTSSAISDSDVLGGVQEYCNFDGDTTVFDFLSDRGRLEGESSRLRFLLSELATGSWGIGVEVPLSGPVTAAFEVQPLRTLASQVPQRHSTLSGPK